jgi:hypothetical protein
LFAMDEGTIKSAQSIKLFILRIVSGLY